MRTDTAIILAGGKSSRMGFDKQSINVDGTPLTLGIAKELEGFFSQIIIVTNKPYLYENSPYEITSDIYPGHGPVSGIHAGLYVCKSEYAYITACDMPYISHGYIRNIVDFIEKSTYDGIVSEYKGFIEPMNGIYSVKLIKVLEEMIRTEFFKIRNIVKKSNFYVMSENEVLDLIGDKNIFMNLNTTDDLDKYIKELKNDV